MGEPELFSKEEEGKEEGPARCPNCGLQEDQFIAVPKQGETAVKICCRCFWSHFNTVATLRHLATLDEYRIELFPGSEERGSIGSFLGGDNPDTGRHIYIGTLLQYIADMLEE